MIITDENLADLVKYVSRPNMDDTPEKRQVQHLAFDLRDARARIKELESLSASQEEALGMMERGQL